MMLPIMLYMLLIACFLGAAAVLAERVVGQMRGPRRAVWFAALAASMIVPLGTVVVGPGAAGRGPAPAAPAAPEATQTFDTAPSARDPAARRAGDAPAFALPDWSRWPFLGDWYASLRPAGGGLDKALAALWIASSVTVLLVYGFAWFGLRRAARGWTAARIDGNEVLISDRLGPAMFGLLKPRVVVPRWLLDAPPGVRALVLRHEHEHASCRDQLLLAAALVLAALAPWNLPVWWHVRRLRVAIEMDCDARVVQGGADTIVYASALLAVRQRRAAKPLAAVALTEPVSQLERRIRVLLHAVPAPSRSVTLCGALLAMGLIAAACAIDPPAAPPGTAEAAEAMPDGQRQPVTGMRIGGERVVILVDVSSTMLDRTLAGIERRRSLTAAQRRDAPKWRQTVSIVEALAADLRPGTAFQIIAFRDTARSLATGTEGQWLTAGAGPLEQAMRTLRNEAAPQGASSLHAAFTAAAALQPAPDNIYVVTDGLPNAGPLQREGSPDDERRLEYFDAATEQVPSGAAVNVILLPREGDALSAPAYWAFALRTGGSLLAPSEDAGHAGVLGVPLDSEYLVFVVDTSGSMRQYAWDDVERHMAETIDAYPSLQGIQILSDQGEYLLEPSENDWIPNSPTGRSRIREALADWSAFSDSRPHEGVLTAIDALYSPGAKVAVYIYGDDVARDSANALLDVVGERNRADGAGTRKARIHAVTFPVFYEVTGELLSAADYASLMRELSQRNGGSFIALPVD